MNVERAKQLAEENGCVIRSYSAHLYAVERPHPQGIPNYLLISDNLLLRLSEPDFIAFYLPDARD